MLWDEGTRSVVHPRIEGEVRGITMPSIDPDGGDPRDAPFLPDLIDGLDAAMECARHCECCRGRTELWIIFAGCLTTAPAFAPFHVRASLLGALSTRVTVLDTTYGVVVSPTPGWSRSTSTSSSRAPRTA